MLNLGKKIIILILYLLLVKCDTKVDNFDLLYNKSTNAVGKNEYINIYNKLNDSINIWVLNKLKNSESECFYNFRIDSLLCFNNDTNRFISCRHLYVNIPEATSDDLQFIYGQKINYKWYFFKGPSIVIPRSMIKNHPTNQPFSYNQLHQIALTEVYGGYLKGNGKINEDWFTEHFENAAYGDFNNQQASDWFLKGKRFRTKKEYFEFVHLEKVRNNWGGINTDSIKHLP